MANRERTGFRDEAYSRWHRKLDDRLSFLDVDWIERCDACKRILAVVELAYDDGNQEDKAAWATQKIAMALGAKGFVVLYSTVGTRVAGFRVRQIAPHEEPVFSRVTERDWALTLYGLRWCHAITPRALPGDAAPVETWPDGINPYVTPERRAELLAGRDDFGLF